MFITNQDTSTQCQIDFSVSQVVRYMTPLYTRIKMIIVISVRIFFKENILNQDYYRKLYICNNDIYHFLL